MSAKRLLYLQNSSSRTSVTKLEQRFESMGLKVDCWWAFNNEFPITLSDFDGVFVSGSPHGAYEDIEFIHREHELIAEAARAGLPILGVCFGHQVIASALCGRDQVFRRSQCEVGYKWLDVNDLSSDDAVTGALKPRFRMFVWHNDEVKGDHPDMNVIATTTDCPNHIFRYRDQAIWGIQGHPELALADAPVWFEENRKVLEADGASVDSLIDSASEARQAKTMLRRFAEVVKGDRKELGNDST